MTKQGQKLKNWCKKKAQNWCKKNTTESMDLEAFVAESLTQIALGVQKAQTEVVKTGGTVNPKNVIATKNDKNLITCDGQGNSIAVRRVEFDMAVTTSASCNGKINIKPTIVGGEAGVESSNQVVSRIKFAVNMALPAYCTDEIEKHDSKCG